MKKIILILILLSFLVTGAWAQDVLINSVPIEVGDILPAPYSCLGYRGRSPDVIGLYGVGCDLKPEGWIYLTISTAGEYPFSWYGEILVLKPTGKGKNQMNLYRRIP